MEDLTITLIQTDLRWEDTRANQRHFEALFEKIDSSTDLIVLPEMFSTGFSTRASVLAQTMSGETVQWLVGMSQKMGVDITGSIMLQDNNRYFNRLLWASPSAELYSYDKKHLFRYAGEERFYTSGQDRLTVNLRGWRIRPFICYDLRFPIWTRNLKNQYDLAIFVANWPMQRATHWRLLLQARAVENQCYVAGVNRLGRDGNQLDYTGDSLIVKPDGGILFDAKDQESVTSVQLSAKLLKQYRDTFPFWMDADTDMVTLN